MRNLIFAFLLVGAILGACSFFQAAPSGEAGNVESVSSDDPEMNAAIQEAQDTLSLFIAALEAPAASQTYFGIKAEFPYGEGNSAEHMWVSDLTLVEAGFEGTLLNEPVYVQGLEFGDHVSVATGDVSDWMIIDGERLLGGFTIHVLRSRMSESERTQFDAEFGYTIPDQPALP